MKPFNRSLRKLLDAAAQAPAEMPEQLPFALEARVLAQWRSLEVEDEFIQLANFFRKAVAFGSLIMILSIGGSWLQSRGESASLAALTSYAISVPLPP